MGPALLHAVQPTQTFLVEEAQSTPNQRQAAIRRCMEQIVVNRKEGRCRITFRKIPMIVGGWLVVATQDVEAQSQCAGPT